MEVSDEFNARIKVLEQFKIDLERRVYGAVAVVSALTALGFIGLFSFKTMTDEFQVILDRTEVLEAKLKTWDKDVTASLENLTNTQVFLTEELQKNAIKISSNLKLELDKISKKELDKLNNTANK